MGTAAIVGKGFNERARVSGERPIGAASFRQQFIQASCQPPSPPCHKSEAGLRVRGRGIALTK